MELNNRKNNSVLCNPPRLPEVSFLSVYAVDTAAYAMSAKKLCRAIVVADICDGIESCNRYILISDLL